MLLPTPCAIAKAAFPPSLVFRTSRPVLLETLCAHSRQPRSPFFVPVRHATHGTQGRVNGSKNSPGKRLGAKKTGGSSGTPPAPASPATRTTLTVQGRLKPRLEPLQPKTNRQCPYVDEYVIPGNIIFRQRGTLWFPGENVGMGRDHTIFALETGFVKYYRNPRLHPKRRYIGVVFDKTQVLPTPPNAVRRRRLNMVAVPRTDGADVEVRTEVAGFGEGGGGVGFGVLGDGGVVGSTLVATQGNGEGGMSKRETKEAKRKKAQGRVPGAELMMRPGYGYRESNYQIGRAAERAGVQVKEFERGNRFLAWRKKSARKARNAEKRALGKKKGAQKKARKQ